MASRVNCVQDDFFAPALVRWQSDHGRHDLPWQKTGDPYWVWLSEIMLQQTQVSTVRDYFVRFIKRFPDVAALAGASEDDVLALWSGLGYYSRARNLHRCAQKVMQLHGGAFPTTALQLQTLPGIGKSTAAAIASLCFGERVAILDGNVKRVLTRFLGFDSDLAVSANEQCLWREATRLLPTQALLTNMPRYTQAVMDLGATVCTARKPACEDCPVKTRCRAHAVGTPEKFPVKTRKLKRSTQSIWLLWATTEAGSVWLTKRPSPGVWAGLYCFELFDDRVSLQAALALALHNQLRDAPVVKHVLTHKDLYLHPVQVVLPDSYIPNPLGAWFGVGQWPQLGLPAPVRKLLTT